MNGKSSKRLAIGLTLISIALTLTACFPAKQIGTDAQARPILDTNDLAKACEGRPGQTVVAENGTVITCAGKEAPAEGETADGSDGAPAPAPADDGSTAASGNSNVTLTGSGPYRSTTMDKFEYTWSYDPQPGNPTPKIRDDAESSGKGVTTTHDIGIHAGEFGVIKGVTITVGVGGQVLGTPCALAVLTPGFYRNIAGTEWRFEVYYLPDTDPLDPTGWSGVLAEQAMAVERDLYGCPEKSLAEIPVFFSDEQAPFGQ